MIYSNVKFRDEAREKMLKGVETLYDAVSTTLGPKGRNVAINRVTPNGEIYERIVVHDGVTVAKSINLQEEWENTGVAHAKQAAQKQVDDVGDGTTVAIVLAYALLIEMNKLIASGVNPMILRKYIEQAAEKVITQIESNAIPTESFQQIKHIATVSAEDEALGKLVAEVFDEMGKDGLIAVEESKNPETTVEKQTGMQIDKGYKSQHFITNEDRMECVLEDVYILVTDKTITSLLPMKALIESEIVKNQKKLVIIAPSIAQDPLQALITNKLRNVFASVVVEAPSFGTVQKDILQDIALYTGARFISDDTKDKLEDIKLEDLGRAEYIQARKSETIIVGGKGKKKDLDDRAAGIRLVLETEPEGYDREQKQARLAKLTTGVAVIHVGGATEVEMRERMERVKDAVAAVHAAFEKGIVPGGETILLTAREVLVGEYDNDTQRMAYNIMYRALYKPFQKLLENAGMNDGEWYERMKNSRIKNKGINVMKEEIIDMVKGGIIDPALVPINALKNGMSVAIQIATTGAVISQFIGKEEKS